MRRLVAVTSIAIGCGVMTSAAMGQSSVTLYGIVDAGVNYLSSAQTGRSPSGLVGHSQ